MVTKVTRLHRFFVIREGDIYFFYFIHTLPYIYMIFSCNHPIFVTTPFKALFYAGLRGYKNLTGYKNFLKISQNIDQVVGLSSQIRHHLPKFRYQLSDRSPLPVFRQSSSLLDFHLRQVISDFSF